MQYSVIEHGLMEKNVKENLWKTHCQSDVFECLWYFIFGVSLIFKDIPWPSHVRRPGSSESTGVLLPNLANDEWWWHVAVGLWAEKFDAKKQVFHQIPRIMKFQSCKTRISERPCRGFDPSFWLVGSKWQKMAMAQKWVIFKKNAWEY